MKCWPLLQTVNRFISLPQKDAIVVKQRNFLLLFVNCRRLNNLLHYKLHSHTQIFAQTAKEFMLCLEENEVPEVISGLRGKSCLLQKIYSYNCLIELKNIALNVFNKSIQLFHVFHLTPTLPIYRNYKSWTEFEVTSQDLVWLISIYCFGHIIKLFIEYTFSLNLLLAYAENNRFYTKVHKTSFGNSISKYKKYLFCCMTDRKGCLRNSRLFVCRRVFSTCIWMKLNVMGVTTKEAKACHCRSGGIHSVLVLGWYWQPPHMTLLGFRLQIDQTWWWLWGPCTLFPTGTVLGMLSLMNFFICWDEFTVQISTVVIWVELSASLKWNSENSLIFLNQHRAPLFFFFFLKRTECDFPAWLLKEFFKKSSLTYLFLCFSQSPSHAFRDVY